MRNVENKSQSFHGKIQNQELSVFKGWFHHCMHKASGKLAAVDQMSRKIRFQSKMTLCSSTHLNIFTMQTKKAYIIPCFQTEQSQVEMISARVGKGLRSDLQCYCVQVLMVPIKWNVCYLEVTSACCFKGTKFFCVHINRTEKHGWYRSCSFSGWRLLIQKWGHKHEG